MIPDDGLNIEHPVRSIHGASVWNGPLRFMVSKVWRPIWTRPKGGTT